MKPWRDMSPQEKADAFDESYAAPTAYQREHFPNGAPPPKVIPIVGKHRKKN